jgi:cyclophilin family peptidyl-prolyl cis-trans isomerase
MKRLILSFFVLLVVSGQYAISADSPQISQSQATFDAIFKDWKTMLARMRTLQEKYQVVAPSERPAVEAEFNQLRQQGQAMAPKLLAAAEEAYRANSKSDPAVGDFLMANVDENVRGENYEEGERIAKLLLEKGYKNKALAAYLGMAEYATGNLEDAKKHLTEAREAGSLESVKPAADALAAVDQKILDWKDEEKIRAAEAQADDLPRVKITTTKGDIVVELFENEAPNTVANFISLVEKGFYNGTKFHRVIPDFMAQGGDPNGNGTGGPGYTIDCECGKANHRKHFRGSLSMAHAGTNTGGSQFFLTFLPTAHLDGLHTVFGRVIEGMDVLSKIQRTEGTARLGPPDKILKVEVIRKRPHAYEPVKNGER